MDLIVLGFRAYRGYGFLYWWNIKLYNLRIEELIVKYKMREEFLSL
jgi:hypothetical protein